MPLTEMLTAREQIHNLRNVRAKLDERVDDPLEQIYATAAGAAASPNRRRRSASSQHSGSLRKRSASSRHSNSSRKKARGRMLERKRTAQSLEFSEDDSDDECGSDRRRIRRNSTGSELSPWKHKKSQKKKYDGRRIWTDEEKDAIKEGMRMFGKGKWAAIKKQFSALLEDRTSSQIKVGLTCVWNCSSGNEPTNTRRIQCSCALT